MNEWNEMIKLHKTEEENSYPQGLAILKKLCSSWAWILLKNAEQKGNTEIMEILSLFTWRLAS